MIIDEQAVLTAAPSISPTAARKTDTVGAAVDLQGYESASVVVLSGAITDGTFTFALTECDTSGGTYTTVSGNDLAGAATVLTSATDDLAYSAFGYVGHKRYIKVNTVVTGSPGTGGIFGAGVVRGVKRHTSV